MGLISVGSVILASYALGQALSMSIIESRIDKRILDRVLKRESASAPSCSSG